jgi:hypothetical protein
MTDKTYATRIVSPTFIGASRKKEEYLAKTPRLIQANKNNDTGNWNFSIFSKRKGERERKRMAAKAGRNMTMAKIFTMTKKEMSMVCPIRRETRAGSVKGDKREETTTIINTSNVEASRSPEIKGATTPVEIPERSKTGTAYSGQMAWVRKKSPAGMTPSLKRHKMKRRKAFFLIS